MFHKLQKANYYLILPFLNNSHLSLNILPIIQQTFKGEIWVDNESSPTYAYIFDTRHGHFLLGDIELDLQSIGQFIEQLLQERFYSSKNYFSFIYESNWSKLLSMTTFNQNHKANKNTRQLYRFESFKITNWRDYVPEGFTIQLVTKELLDSKVKNKGFLFDELTHMWGNVDNFFTIGFGTCAIYQDSLAGFCLGEYFVPLEEDKKFGIGIETFPEFQHKGIATAMTSLLLEIGLEKGYSIYWDCFKENITSWKTALKVGFVLDMEYDVLFGKF